MEKKKNNKKILIAVCLIITALAIGYLLVGKSSIGKGVSGRAREFVQQQQQAGNREWTGIDLDKPYRPGTVKGTQIIEVGNCFSFDLPFPISLRKKMGDCFVWFSIDSPKGQVTAYLNKTQLKNLDEDSGVHMRRVNNDKYQEEKKTFGQKEFLIFKNTTTGYEASAFYLQNNNLIVLNLLSSTNENLDKKFFQMLESLQINSK